MRMMQKNGKNNPLHAVYNECSDADEKWNNQSYTAYTGHNDGNITKKVIHHIKAKLSAKK